MNNPSKMDLLHQAKELTGSNDVHTLIQAATQLQQYLVPCEDVFNVLDDFVKFAPYCTIQHPSRGRIAFDLHPYQKMAGYAMQYSNFTLINTSRQMGITTLISAYLLWEAAVNPNRNIVYMANTYNTTSEVLDRIKYMSDQEVMMDLKGQQTPLFPKMLERNRSSIRFVNGSNISFVTFNIFDAAMRGRTIDTLVVDNAAYLPYKHDRDMMAHIGITLMHGSNKKVIVASTPNRPQGFFYDLWTNTEENQASRVFLPYFMHPGRDAAWLEQMSKHLPQSSIENEYLCKFVDRK